MTDQVADMLAEVHGEPNVPNQFRAGFLAAMKAVKVEHDRLSGLDDEARGCDKDFWELGQWIDEQIESCKQDEALSSSLLDENEKTELLNLRMAVGLATTLKPTMVMRSDDVIGMMQEEVARQAY